MSRRDGVMVNDKIPYFENSIRREIPTIEGPKPINHIYLRLDRQLIHQPIIQPNIPLIQHILKHPTYSINKPFLNSNHFQEELSSQ